LPLSDDAASARSRAAVTASGRPVVTNVQSRSVSRTDSGGELITTTNAGSPTSPAP
jgi:hypothetical protein